MSAVLYDIDLDVALTAADSLRGADYDTAYETVALPASLAEQRNPDTDLRGLRFAVPLVAVAAITRTGRAGDTLKGLTANFAGHLGELAGAATRIPGLTPTQRATILDAAEAAAADPAVGVRARWLAAELDRMLPVF